MAQEIFEIGEPVTHSAWFEPGYKKRVKKQIEEQLKEGADGQGIRLSQITWSVLAPDDPEIPDPPGWASRAVRLLLAETQVIGFKESVLTPGSSFLLSLDPRDHARMREVTRSAYAKEVPGNPPLTDFECDAIIEQQGPETVQNILRQAVDTRLVN